MVTGRRDELPIVDIAQLNEVGSGDYLASNFIISDVDPQRIDKFKHPCRLNGGAFCICLHGSCKVSLNLNNYEIKPNDLVVVSPGSIIQLLEKSNDFRGYIVLFSVDFVKAMDVQSVVPLYAFIQDNPCLSQTPEETGMLLKYCSFLYDKSRRSDHIYNKEITQHLLLGLFYEISALYQREMPVDQRELTRHEQLLKKLLHLVFVHCHTERSVGFYAQQLCLTPKYLSSLVKRISGRTVSEWIDAVVILEAKAQLKSTQMTVQQISDSLNFPNPSFFGRYFKQHTGMTPKEYRLS